MAPETTLSRIFRFGMFEANEATGELRKEGIRIKLHAQPFQVLVMLLERPAQLVTRDELRQRLWDEETFVDFDHGLNTAVNKLRDALGDFAAQPRFVETVSGKGYRFLAPVTLVAPAANLPSPAAAQPYPGTGGTSVAPAPNASSSSAATSQVIGQIQKSANRILTGPHDLPSASRRLVAALLLLTQMMYLAFYLAALANLPEIHAIFADAALLSPSLLMTLLVGTAVMLIPVRLYLFAAVAFDFRQLAAKFHRLFPLLLVMDLLWALSPFLLVHHVSGGLALGLTAALVYMPFAQRSLVLMYARG